MAGSEQDSTDGAEGHLRARQDIEATVRHLLTHTGGTGDIFGRKRDLGHYVVVSLSNIDPPAASELADFFALRMPDR